MDSSNTLNDGAISILVNYINVNPKVDFFFAPVEKSGKIYSGFKPDQIKIYPCQVIKGARLESDFKKGKYKPYDENKIKEMIIKITL